MYAYPPLLTLADAAFVCNQLKGFKISPLFLMKNYYLSNIYIQSLSGSLPF